jgi:SP family facilitated glucose transporter-like MFS transporter 8
MAVIAASLAQKCNRKVLLYISTVGMGTFAFIASTQMSHLGDSAHSVFLKKDLNVNVTAAPTDPTTSATNNYLLLVCVLGYMLFASLGILIIPWTLISELYPIKYKGKFGGVSIAIAYTLMSFILKTFPIALETFSISVIFAIFGGVSYLTAVFVFFYLPETHRKSFAEIEQHFIGRRT